MSNDPFKCCPACDGEGRIETGEWRTCRETGAVEIATEECDLCGGTGGVPVPTLGEGDKVRYRARSGISFPGTIIGTGIEAGQPVYDVELEDGGETKWGYADQFELVSSYDGPTEPDTAGNYKPAEVDA